MSHERITRGKESLFSSSSRLTTASSEDKMKDLVFRLMSDSPKAKLHYGNVRDVLRKPFSVHFSQGLPECTCSHRKMCYACMRLASLRGRGPFETNAHTNRPIPSGGFMTKTDGGHYLPSTFSIEEIHSGESDASFPSHSEEESSDDDIFSVADMLQSLFHEADSDAKKTTKECLRKYRDSLISEQSKRFSAMTAELQSRDSLILSEYVERRHKLENELCHAEKIIDDQINSGPLSPVSAMIKQLEQNRHGRNNEFRVRLEAVHTAFAKSNEIEGRRAEIESLIRKLEVLLQRSRTLPSSNPQLQESMLRITEAINAQLAQLSPVNIETMPLETVNKVVGDASQFHEECNRVFDQCEKIASNTNAPAVPVQTAAQPQTQPVASAAPSVTSLVSADAECQITATESRQFVDSWRSRLKPFIEDPSWKQQRSDLQRAVFSYVNMLSSETDASSNVVVNLNRLLDGSNVEIAGGKIVSTSCHPLAVDFAKLAVCKKLIGQAEEEVSSQPSVAMPLAAAALQIVASRPDMAKLMLTFFYNACPMLVPVDVVKSGNLNADQMLEQLGYKRKNDGEFEGIERFLKRMTGIVVLFSAMAVATVPTNSRPITVGTIWTLATRIMKSEPFPDLTATVLYEILKTCSKQLYSTYGRQFDKLARTLKAVYLPHLEATTERDSASTSTLRHFINTEVAAICNWPLPQKH